MHKLVKTRALIDGTGAAPIPGGCMLLRDDRIEAVGTIEAIGPAPAGAEIIELTDRYVMPGLVNAHTHLSIVPGDGDQLGQMRQPAATKILRSTPNILKDMNSGVTTMRIMGEEHFIDMDFKLAIENGTINGPRLKVAGVGLVASNGHGVALTVSDGVDEVRRNARRNLGAGADFLKIFATGGLSSARRPADACTYSRAEIAAAVEEAERAGTYVSAHAQGGSGIDLCIEEGVRTIEHGALVTERQLEAIIKHDRWIVATSSILFHHGGIEKTDFGIPAIKAKVLAARAKAKETFARVIQSNANLAVGTDSVHGMMSFEMECLVEFGATSMQAILAATRNAAAACRMESEVGTLEKGKFADFIALKGNPVEDIRHMRDVEAVYKGGVRFRGV
ncbi:MAG: amidohydrolase family protein [Lautropia sp.]